MIPIQTTWYGVDLEIPDGVTKIRPYAYLNGEDLRSVKIPTSVAEIGEGAFDGCVNLEEISVHPENQHYTDAACGVLFSKDETRLIRVPENYHGLLMLDHPLQTIEKGAFKGCNAINIILCAEPLFPQLQQELRDYEEVPDVNIIDDCGMMFDTDKTSMGATLWPICGRYVVPDGVEEICAIYSILDDVDFEDFTDITIPASVIIIDPCAFDRCPNLTIHAPAGSYAINFAKDHGIPYTEIL